MTSAALPVTWSALLDDRRTIDDQLERLGDLERDAADPGVDPEDVLYMAADCIAGLAVLLGPGAAKPALDVAIAHDLPRAGVKAAAAVAGPHKGLSLAGVLTAANACAICGAASAAPRKAEVEALLKFATEGMDRYRDGARFRAAFIAVAYDLPNLAATFAFGKPRSGEFKAGEDFGPNLQALVHYLVQAAAAGADGEAVDAAIRGALATFPHKLQDDQLRWGDVGWLGRLRFHTFGKAPLGDVADLTFDYVRTL